MKSLYQNSRYDGLLSRFCNKICKSKCETVTSKELVNSVKDYDKFLTTEIKCIETRLENNDDAIKKFNKGKGRVHRDQENIQDGDHRSKRGIKARMSLYNEAEKACEEEKLARLKEAKTALGNVKTMEALDSLMECYHPERVQAEALVNNQISTGSDLLNLQVSDCPLDGNNRFCDDEEINYEEEKVKKDKPIARKDVKSEKVTSNKSVVVNNNDKVRTSSEKVTIYKTAEGDLDLSKMDTETMSKAPETRSYLKYLVAKYVDRKDNLQDVFDTNEQFQWSDSKSGQLYRYKSGPDYNLSQREKALIPLAKFRAETNQVRDHIASLAEGNPNISVDGDTVSFIDYSSATTPNKDSVESTRYEISFDDEGRAKYKITQNFAGNFIQERFDDEFNYTLEEGADLSEIKLTETGPRFDGRSDKTSTFNINSNFKNKKTGRTQSGEKYVSGKLDTIYKALDRALKYSGDSVDPIFA